jgi:hypothetical protein
MDSPSDFVYSYVGNTSPRIVKTLAHTDYKKLSRRRRERCINLSEQVIKVLNALDMDITKHLYPNLSPKELDVYMYDVNVPGGVKITVDGKTKGIEEHTGYVCFEGANFITKLWMLEEPTTWDLCSVKLSLIPERIVPEQLSYMYGVFKFDLATNVEDHSFVLYMAQDTITVFNSYGGTVGVFTPEFSRMEWLDMFLNFPELSLKDQKKTYHRPWGFSK